MREGGWTHWHHLFTPSQGLLAEWRRWCASPRKPKPPVCLGWGAADWNSKLSRWWPDPAGEKVIQTFSNQALNTLFTLAAGR